MSNFLFSVLRTKKETVSSFLSLALFASCFIHSEVVEAQSVPVGYDEFCGLPVIVERTSQDALADFRKGQRVIILDPSVLMNWKLSRVYAIAHECGHHILGHLSNKGRFERIHMNATRKQELQADCWAAEKLAKNGYLDDLRRTIIQRHLEGPIMQGPYPSGTDRAEFIATCGGFRIDSTDGGQRARNIESSKITSSGDFCQDMELIGEAVAGASSNLFRKMVSTKENGFFSPTVYGTVIPPGMDECWRPTIYKGEKVYSCKIKKLVSDGRISDNEIQFIERFYDKKLSSCFGDAFVKSVESSEINWKFKSTKIRAVLRLRTYGNGSLKLRISNTYLND